MGTEYYFFANKILICGNEIYFIFSKSGHGLRINKNHYDAVNYHYFLQNIQDQIQSVFSENKMMPQACVSAMGSGDVIN